jgi:hypothetical protein
MSHTVYATVPGGAGKDGWFDLLGLSPENKLLRTCLMRRARDEMDAMRVCMSVCV